MSLLTWENRENNRRERKGKEMEKNGYKWDKKYKHELYVTSEFTSILSKEEKIYISLTWMALTWDLGLQHPQFFSLLQSEDDIRFGVLISCEWKITYNLGQKYLRLWRMGKI